MELRIRHLGQRDFEFAVNLTNLEGWGLTPEDFRRLSRLNPKGCFVAIQEGRRVGVVATTVYGRSAWIGSLIVIPEMRGRAIGTLLVEHALEYLRMRKVETVRLYSYPKTAPFYQRLGFTEEGEVLRLLGAGRTFKSQHARKMVMKDLSQVAKFDRRFFGSNRSQLLRVLHNEFEDFSFVLTENGKVLGYVTAKGKGIRYELGPWVSTPGRVDVAEELLHSCLSSLDGKEIEISIPAENDSAAKLCKEHGFAEYQRCVRMRHGPDRYGEDAAAIFAVCALEKG